MKGFGHALPPTSSQLLTLKTLGIIQIKQVQSFGGIGITRTVRGSKRVSTTPVLTPRCRLTLQAQLAEAANHIQQDKGVGGINPNVDRASTTAKERIKPCYPRAENEHGVHGT